MKTLLILLLLVLLMFNILLYPQTQDLTHALKATVAFYNSQGITLK